MGDWKLIRWYEDRSVELYRLSDDPGETRNLAGTMPEEARRLEASLDKWLEAMGPAMPVANPDYDATRETEGLAPAIREQLVKGELPTPGK